MAASSTRLRSVLTCEEVSGGPECSPKGHDEPECSPKGRLRRVSRCYDFRELCDLEQFSDQFGGADSSPLPKQIPDAIATVIKALNNPPSSRGDVDQGVAINAGVGGVVDVAGVMTVMTKDADGTPE